MGKKSANIRKVNKKPVWVGAPSATIFNGERNTDEQSVSGTEDIQTFDGVSSSSTPCPPKQVPNKYAPLVNTNVKKCDFTLH